VLDVVLHHQRDQRIDLWRRVVHVLEPLEHEARVVDALSEGGTLVWRQQQWRRRRDVQESIYAGARRLGPAGEKEVADRLLAARVRLLNAGFDHRRRERRVQLDIVDARGDLAAHLGAHFLG